jgi:hypothetical protein
VSGRPSTIDETVALINALRGTQGGTVTLPCFIESLDRPIGMHAAASIFSAQPAVGRRSPRIFLFTEGLSMSIVPEGIGLPFLEMGQLTSAYRSIKAELEFPVSQTLTRESPYQRLAFGRVTGCGVCHRDEMPVFGIKDAVESDAYRPRPELDVPVDEVRTQHAACDAAVEPTRCKLLGALFGNGPVQHQPFPPEMPTF